MNVVKYTHEFHSWRNASPGKIRKEESFGGFSPLDTPVPCDDRHQRLTVENDFGMKIDPSDILQKVQLYLNIS